MLTPSTLVQITRDLQSSPEYQRIINPRHLASVYVFCRNYLGHDNINGILNNVLGHKHHLEYRLYRQLWLRMRTQYRIRFKRDFYRIVEPMVRAEVEKIIPQSEQIVDEINKELADLPY